NKTLINIKYQPIARFKLSAVLCNNELTQFTDLTGLPVSATGESVSKWHWVFDNTITHASQHPGLYFVAGNHKAALVAETNFGCRSFPADSLFTVHAKPQVQVSKTDSCVFRNITFSATSVLNNVSAWYWDFGAGPTQGTSVTNKTYVTKGVYPFTLLTQTVHGCQDTVVQPFMIYDNKILAGRDTVVAINEPVQLNANGGVNVTYAWSPATGLNNTSLENPVATLDFDQRYELYAVTDKGCDSRSSLLIKRYAGPTIYIPSAFTPNNNGKNDLLKVVPVGMKLFKYFAVFNRYGEMIFKTTDPAKGWDGRYKGTLLPTATFVVLAEAIDYRGRPFVQKATVTLVR
ncbi:MAG TPA: T9SS type B sorting domain-containing protein, partial [Flavisolibacter sp.]|nr:T9SS type B sorting domain-containing protein [Flavisolibacter sp.]